MGFTAFAPSASPTSVLPVRLPALLRPLALSAPLALVALAGCSSTTPAAAPAGPDPVVATWGRERLTLSQFEHRYVRSVGGRAKAATDSVAAYRDFLGRYVDFRLKVDEARRLGIDRKPEVIAEAAEYRRSLARPYLLEQRVIEPVVRMLYDRQGQIVDVSHLLIGAGEDASPADTLAAFRKANAVADSIRSGALAFDAAARRHSDDPSARSGGLGEGGRLGYFSAGVMVDPFEDAAYTAPIGAVTGPIRTSFGYHVILVHDRRATPLDREIAHVMVVPEAATPDAEAAAKQRLQAVLDSVRAGTLSFEDAARRHSADTDSGPRGGTLGFIPYSAQLIEPFKSTAFALARPGDVSDIIQTRFGFHVVRFVSEQPRPTFETAYAQLKGTAARTARAQSLQNALADSLLGAMRTTRDDAFLAAQLARVPADSIAYRLVTQAFAPDALATTLLTIGDSTYTFADLAGFAYSTRVRPGATTAQTARNYLDAFARDRVLDVQTARLESTDAEFARVMQEFRDGIVLFRIMDDSVWSAARTNEALLRQTYAADPARYRFGPRTRLVTFEAPSDSMLSAVRAAIASGMSLADAASGTVDGRFVGVIADTVYTDGPSQSVFDRALALPVGGVTEALPYRGSTLVVIANDGIEGPRPKTFEEARPELETAAQGVLEARFIERLRRAARVRLYPERVEGAFRQPGAASSTTL